MSTLINNNTKSQCQLILSHLMSGKTITPVEAYNEYRCFRLGARIYDLKQLGYSINKKMIKNKDNGKSYAEYSMRNN